MKILVTGANGFIGRRLSARLVSKGEHVYGLSSQAPSREALGFKAFYQQDISKPFTLNTKFDVVVHLAAYNITHIGNKDQDLYAAVNVDGTKHILGALETKQFIYLSTAKVYKCQGLPIAEDAPLGAQGAYAQSKLKAEEVCRSLIKEGRLVILRSVNVMGYGQAPKAVLPVFFEKAQKNQSLDIIQSAQTLMQFVYVEDLIDAIEAAISTSAQGVFNIANEETISLEEMAKAIIAKTHSTSMLNITRNAPEGLFSPVICQKAYQQLGWKAKINFATVLDFYNQAYVRAF